jgi:precorrin-6A/cobalt-precorrin-6A reductase
MKRVLILGGTGDANRLAAKAALLPNITVITSLAGRTQTPILSAGEVRIGHFGGIQGLVDYLQIEKIDGLIDATHPFAAQISWHAAAAAEIVKIPRLMLVRPAWQKAPTDRWVEVESLEAAALLLPHFAQRVFLTIGRQELAAFTHLTHIWFLMRMIEPPAGAVPPGLIVLERGPFTDADEQLLLINHEIEAIVSKNSGGAATEAKLRAARALEIPVVMVQRPPLPEGEQVTTVEAALLWIVNRSGQV